MTKYELCRRITHFHSLIFLISTVICFFSFSLQVLTLTQSHWTCQEALGQQSSAPSCDEVKTRAPRSSGATGVARWAWVADSSDRTPCVRRPRMLFSVQRGRCGCLEDRGSRTRPARTSRQTNTCSSACAHWKYPWEDFNIPTFSSCCCCGSSHFSFRL